MCELGRASRGAASAAEMLAARDGPARPSPYLSTRQFPWLRSHPPPPSRRTVRRRARRARWGRRGACAAPGPGGAPQSYPRGGRATSAARARPPARSPAPRSAPRRACRRGPRHSAAPGPAAARGRGAAQAKLLSCFARSEVAAETAASRPLPALGDSKHTPSPSPPAACPRPRRPGPDSAASPPGARQEPRFPAESGWGRAHPTSPLRPREGEAAAGGSPRDQGAFALCKAEQLGRGRPQTPAPSPGEAGFAEREPGSVPIASRGGFRQAGGRGSAKGLRSPTGAREPM